MELILLNVVLRIAMAGIARGETAPLKRYFEIEEAVMHWDYGWGIGFGFGWILMILFWVLVVLGIIYLVKAITGSARKGEKEETALDILKKRYAKGEITKEEFDQMKGDITGKE